MIFFIVFLVTARAIRIWPKTTLLAYMNIPLYPLSIVISWVRPWGDKDGLCNDKYVPLENAQWRLRPITFLRHERQEIIPHITRVMSQ